MKNTDDLLKAGDDSFKESQDYNGNFSKVLANTRDQKADKKQLLNFFAQPLSIENLTKKISTLSHKFDWRWSIILSLGILIGILSSITFRSISIRKNIK